MMTEEEKEEVYASNELLVRAYRQTFNSAAGQEVLIDLMRFCRFRAPLQDPVLLDEGKRQVFVRIENFLTLTPHELQRLLSGQRFPRPA